MKHSHCATLLLLCVVSIVSSDVIQYARMIWEVTRTSPFSFNGYGCYCGLRGRKKPKDEIDWCCHTHDCCYKKLKSLGCFPLTEKYTYNFQNGISSCEGRTMCEKTTCECDMACALCFQRNSNTFNFRYALFPNILCRGVAPPCE